MKKLKHLVKRGLFNAGLVELTPTLVGRYNDCLEAMGLGTSRSKEIFVDGAGWSPQVARERQNPYYLHNGLVNPNAIIVTPEQYKKPIFFPVFSWVRGALRVVFETNHRAIYDVNSTHWIMIDFDNGLSTLEGPLDLLLLTSITAQLGNGGLSEIGEKQASLVANFSEGLRCLDDAVRTELRAHALEHGDLRKRKLELKPTVFDTFTDFYTVAFDGAAVLRAVDGDDLLILENQQVFESVRTEASPGAKICFLHDADNQPIRLLQKAGLIVLPVESFRADPRILEDKRQLLIGQSLCDADDDIDWDTCSPIRRKSLIGKHEDKVPRIYAELERFMAALKRGSRMDISEELFMYLATPADLPPATQEVLWILLTRREPRRLLELYDYDKNKFIAEYGGWTDSKQKWVADYVAARYVPRGKRP